MKPIHLKLFDQQFPIQGVAHQRPNARAFLQNKVGLFCFNHIVTLDKFGSRNYIETPGGGIDEGESPEQAVLREIQEECGMIGTILEKIGTIEDEYRLIHRQNINHYYLVQVIREGNKHWTEQEHRLIQAQPWLSLDEALRWYQSLPDHGIAQLIKQREIPPLLWVQKYLSLRK
jgi:8-oxo-dGTP diphosphatase